MAANIALDGALRDWVLFPILLVMVVAGVLRLQIASLLSASPQSRSLKAIKEA